MLKSRPALLWTLPFLFMLCQCNPQDKVQIQKSVSTFDIEQGRASILQSNKHFMKALAAGDTADAASTYTSDAKLMPHKTAEVTGRKKIASFIASEIQMGLKDFDLETVSIWGDSSLLAEEGTYELLGNEGKTLDKGKYITLWKSEGGNWKKFRHIWTSDLPGEAPIDQ